MAVGIGWTRICDGDSGGGGTIAVTVASATPTYNGTNLITVTPTGITPTSYTFILPDEERGYTVVTQAGNTYNWTVTSVGTDVIEVIATDGVSYINSSVSVTVTEPLDYLTRLNHWRADTGITLVGGLVDTWADQGTSGNNFTASVSSHRPYYDDQRNMLGAQSGNQLDNAAGGYVGKNKLTFFFITQKLASVSTNTRLVEFGASAAVGIAPVGVAGSYDLTFGYGNYTSYIQVQTGLMNGQCVIVTYDGTLGSNRTVAYANGVALTPFATVGLGGPTSISAGAGMRLFLSLAGGFNYLGTLAVLGVMDGVLTPTQIAALNTRLKQIHI